MDRSLRPLATAYLRRFVRNAERFHDRTPVLIMTWGLGAVVWGTLLVRDLVTGRSPYISAEFSFLSLLWLISLCWLRPMARRRLMASAALLAGAA
jgi:hypothetical protein